MCVLLTETAICVFYWQKQLYVCFTDKRLYVCFTDRNSYMCAVHASKMMVPTKQGLIVNISSAGGLVYLFNVAYGVGKEAVSSN